RHARAFRGEALLRGPQLGAARDGFGHEDVERRVAAQRKHVVSGRLGRGRPRREKDEEPDRDQDGARERHDTPPRATEPTKGSGAGGPRASRTRTGGPTGGPNDHPRDRNLPRDALRSGGSREVAKGRSRRASRARRAALASSEPAQRSRGRPV